MHLINLASFWRDQVVLSSALGVCTVLPVKSTTWRQLGATESNDSLWKSEPKISSLLTQIKHSKNWTDFNDKYSAETYTKCARDPQSRTKRHSKRKNQNTHQECHIPSNNAPGTLLHTVDLVFYQYCK